MINSLKLIHFKSHRDTEIEFKNLTVLCGANGVGKSSLIQTLLLLRQTHNSNKLETNLFLNGNLYDIGNVKDALHVSNQGEFYKKIIFEMNYNDSEQNKWLFDADSDYNFLELLNKTDQNFSYRNLALFNNNFQYISAFRSSEQVRANDFEVVQQNQISYNKGKGDMVAHYLNYYGKKVEVLKRLRHPNAKFPFLEEQVSAWESDIVSSGVEVISEKVTDNQYSIKYNFNLNSLELAEHKFTAENVGFGYSYTLPLVVAILSSQPNSLLLIENPEAHLHPYSISRLTELICIAAQVGIQIVIETHSDHVINGILVQSKIYEDTNSERGINRNNISLYQLDKDPNEQYSIAIPVHLESGGRIYSKPTGFFDQIANDLRELL